MMPLTMINTGEEAVIQRVKGNEETKRFLENLGFVSGTKVNIVSSIGGNIIVNIKDSRIAVNQDMARHIMV
ncbi:FeoA family protein [Anaerofustis sp.]|uniref:FeoA family protein n=1 Tax=Anaerofustis sp. TaxID=1872517 RepID=UPI0025BC2D91|nr:FeoA family protein [Anaerofustis sp.]